MKKQLKTITGIAMLLIFVVATGSVAVQIVPPVFAASVPSPTTYLTYPTGTLFLGNGSRTPYYEIYNYYMAVANSTASSRVKVYRFGYSDWGRPQIAAVITAPSNWSHMASNQKAINALYDPRITSPAQAQQLIQTTLPILMVDPSQHSGESGSPEMALDLLYKLAAGTDPDTMNILNNEIVIINALQNPDGHDFFVNWHYQWGPSTNVPNIGGYTSLYPGGDFGFPAGQQYTGLAGSTPPMWSKYVNHDNNRDWDGTNLIENQNIVKFIENWKPQVFEDHHEGTARIWTPPNPDIINPNISPIGRMQWLMYGAHIDEQAASQNLPGYVSGAGTQYDMWYLGYGDTVPTLHGAAGMTFETQGANFDRNGVSPTGMEKGFGVSMSQSLPWQGGLWTTADNVMYQEGATWSDMEYLAHMRSEVLWSYYEQFYQEVQWGKTTSYGNIPSLQPPYPTTCTGLTSGSSTCGPLPYAFIVPPAEQSDLGTMAKMLNHLTFQAIEVSKATNAFTISSYCSIIANTCSTTPKTFAAGSYIIRMDQPMRAMAKGLMETQTYPTGILKYMYGGGAGGDTNTVGVVPYDVTAWTIPMAMGITTYNVTDPTIFNVPMTLTPTVKINGGVIGGPATYGYAFSHHYNDAFTAMNRLFKAGFTPLYLANSSFIQGATTFDQGTVIVPQATGLDAMIANLASTLSVPFYALSSKPTGVPVYAVTQPKIGMIYTYSTSEDEGWTRWLLDHGPSDLLHTGNQGNPAENEFQYTYLNPISIDTGYVNGSVALGPLSQFTAILIPSGVSLGGNSSSRAPDFQKYSSICGPYVCPNWDPHYSGGEFPYVKPASQTTSYYGEQLGIDSYGIANLKSYMTNGGTIIAETSSALFAPVSGSCTSTTSLCIKGISTLSTSNIPSYGGDGVYLKVNTNPQKYGVAYPVVYGMPSSVAGFWENNLIYAVNASATAVAFYDPTSPLMSGWLIDNGRTSQTGPGQFATIAGKVSVAMSAYGSGRAIVFAFKLENRDKDDATWPLLFNSIYYSSSTYLAGLP